MTSTRHRNKTNSPDGHPPAPAGNDVAKKVHKPGKAASAPASAGLPSKLFSFVRWALVIAVAACMGWLLYTLMEEALIINRRLQHLSEQKGELAETVNDLRKQVDMLQKTVGRVEFISKDIQEKQQSHDSSIKNSEKELDVVGVILKKLQKDLSNVIQDVKDQGDRDLDLFDKTMKEKFNELNKSINEEIVDLTEVQKSSQEDINNVKATIASLGDVSSITDELRRLQEHFSEIQTSYKSKEESVDWLMNNALNIDTVTTNRNEIEVLKSEHDLLKRGIEEHLTTVAALEEKLSADDESSLKGELDKVLEDFNQLSSSVKEFELHYVATNNDLLKEIQNDKQSVERRLKSVESATEALNFQKSTLESLSTSFEDYSRRLNAVEEAFAGVKHLTSGTSESPEATKTMSILEEAQKALSQQVEELRSVVATPNIEKLQVEVTSALEGHKQQFEDLKFDYDQWKSSVANAGSSDQAPGDGSFQAIPKLESDLKRLREAVDSLVAYSVKIETHDKDLESLKESLDYLKETTDKLQVKFEHIQENV